MGWFDQMRRPPSGSAKQAKERLQIVIAHERLDRNGPDYLPQLRRDILDVIRKYVPVTDDKVQVQFEHGADYDILELNVTLPDRTA
jgi:cell division topological specificity factor